MGVCVLQARVIPPLSLMSRLVQGFGLSPVRCSHLDDSLVFVVFHALLLSLMCLVKSETDRNLECLIHVAVWDTHEICHLSSVLCPLNLFFKLCNVCKGNVNVSEPMIQDHVPLHNNCHCSIVSVGSAYLDFLAFIPLNSTEGAAAIQQINNRGVWRVIYRMKKSTLRQMKKANRKWKTNKKKVHTDSEQINLLVGFKPNCSFWMTEPVEKSANWLTVKFSITGVIVCNWLLLIYQFFELSSQA